MVGKVVKMGGVALLSLLMLAIGFEFAAPCSRLLEVSAPTVQSPATPPTQVSETDEADRTLTVPRTSTTAVMLSML